MVNFNSTIFRTITDDITGTTKSVGLLGKSFDELKSILNSIKSNGLFNANIISDKDILCIHEIHECKRSLNMRGNRYTVTTLLLWRHIRIVTMLHSGGPQG